MPYSIEHYKQVYHKSLEKITSQTTHDVGMCDLLAIREVMLAYEEKSRRTFLGFPCSNLNHVNKAKAIIKLIEAHCEKKSNSAYTYKNILKSIEAEISKAEALPGYNSKGDFANISKCLKLYALSFNGDFVKDALEIKRRAEMSEKFSHNNQNSEDNDSFQRISNHGFC